MRMQTLSELNYSQRVALVLNCGFDSYKVSVNWQTVKKLLFNIECLFSFQLYDLHVLCVLMVLPELSRD